MSLTGFLLSSAYATEGINTLQQQAWETECSVSLSLSSVDNSCHGGLTGPDISDLFFIIELRIVLFFFFFSSTGCFYTLAILLGKSNSRWEERINHQIWKKKKISSQMGKRTLHWCLKGHRRKYSNQILLVFIPVTLKIKPWTLGRLLYIGHLTPPLWFVQKMRNVLSP